MITSLLSFSSTVTASRNLNIARISPNSLLQKLFNDIQPLASQRGISFTYQNNSNQNVFYTDKELLLRIVSNVISNALKFTKEGGTVDIYLTDIDPGKISIRIADSGVGMNKETKEQIFGAFFQADSSSTREFGGVGLGLSLVKVASEQLEAKISVESELGQGSIFTIEVPSLKHLLPDKKILIIGASEVLRNSLRLVLEQEGFKLSFIEDSDVTDSLNEIECDLILLDGIVQESDIKIVKKIVEKDRFANIPILGLINAGDNRLRHLALDSGVTDLLSKPFDIQKILDRIKYLIESSNQINETVTASNDTSS